MSNSPAEAIDVSGTYTVQPDNSISVIYQEGVHLTMHSSRWGPPRGVLSGNTISAKFALIPITGKFENGVITWSTGHVSTREGPAPADPSEATSKDSEWFLGKRLKEKLDTVGTAIKTKEAAKAEGAYESSHGAFAVHNSLKKKRPLATRQPKSGSDERRIGTVTVTVVGGQFSTTRPYLILELDGNEERTAAAKSSKPTWGEGYLEQAKFSFPVYDPSSDLRVSLCDDASLANEVPVGRVLIPVRQLCSEGLLPFPRPALRSQFSFAPAHRQWSNSQATEAKYREAVPNLAGTGMVKPGKDLGYVELLLQLHLDVPGHERFGLLAAYAFVEPQNETQTDELTPHLANVKIIRSDVIRFWRNFRLPYILREPFVYSLPLVLYIASYHAQVYHLPALIFLLTLMYGWLEHKNIEDGVREMIFWEDAVGEDLEPKGLAILKQLTMGLAQVQLTLGKATNTLSKQNNVFKFADPAVSLVAYACLGVGMALATLVLYLVPARTLIFLLGMGVLLPFLLRQPTVPKPGQGERLNEKVKPTPPLPAADKGPPTVVRMCLNILARSPSWKDLAHRHFCNMQERR